jgi:acyl carrier protein
MDKAREKIRTFVVENFLFGDDKGLADETSFLENGIIDSMGILELVAYLGEEFNVTVADEELLPENLDSINNVLKFLKKKNGSGA